MMLNRILPVLFVFWVICTPAQAMFGGRKKKSKTQKAVCRIKVLSDKVEDVSTLKTIIGRIIKPGMTDEQKGLAVWQEVVKFRHQNSPPQEFINGEGQCVHDPVKTFNVYGYGQCCCASSNIECLARAAGLKARGRIVHSHSVPEVYWGGDWHLLDASLMQYFRDAGGEIASVDEIIESVSSWLKKHPELNSDAALRKFEKNGGWKKGPKVLATCKQFDNNGRLPGGVFGWHSSVDVYNGQNRGIYEYGYSAGYNSLFRLRPGEVLIRNWSNKGLHVNMRGGKKPSCIDGKIGEGGLKYHRGLGDLAPGRVGNGTLKYEVPLKDKDWVAGAWEMENLAAAPAIAPKDSKQTASVVFRMHCPYVFLSGKITMQAVLKNGAAVKVLVSTNNAMDFTEVKSFSGPEKLSETIDISEKVFRRYDYYVKFVMEGRVKIDELVFEDDIEQSQRALPALDKGKNTIKVTAGPQIDTLTIEPTFVKKYKDKNEYFLNFHPVLDGVREGKNTGVWCHKGSGILWFPVRTPGDIQAIRLGGYFRARKKNESVEMVISFDEGKTVIKAGEAPGPYAGYCKFVEFEKVPKGMRGAWVGFRLKYGGNTVGIFSCRIDVDYWDTPDGKPAKSKKLPYPIKITYIYGAGGEKKYEHVIKKVPDKYSISCSSRPLMKSIIVEPVD